ncbi:Transcription factor spt20, partial [Linnemannia zychae]
MVTAIEHHNQQQPQSSQYGTTIQTSNLTSNTRAPKSPHVNLTNGLTSPTSRGGGGHSKKTAGAKASLSLQTKISNQSASAKSESPLTAMSSPGTAEISPTLERTGRGVKRSRDEDIATIKDLGLTDLLIKHRNSPASFVIHLYETHFKFENQDGVFLFNSPMKIFLKSIQEKKLPSGLLDVIKSAQCPYYEGRLIVEVVDHRTIVAQDNKASKKRVILSPSQETLWADLSLLHEESGENWSSQLMLDVESKILIATEEPLCLDPSPMVTVLSNQISYHQTSATQRTRKKRKWNSLEREQEAARKVEEDKLMSMMDEKASVDFQPSFGRLAFLKEWRQRKKAEEIQPIPVLDPKKSKAKRQEMSVLPDGRKIVRTIRFEREDKKRGYKVYFMFNIMQCPDLSFEAIMRYGTAPDSAVNGGIRKFHLGPEQCADAYVQSLKSLYFSPNSLISETTPTSTNTTRASAAAAAANPPVNAVTVTPPTAPAAAPAVTNTAINTGAAVPNMTISAASNANNTTVGNVGPTAAVSNANANANTNANANAPTTPQSRYTP